MDGARSTSTWEALAVRVGEEIGISDWIEVSQSRIAAPVNKDALEFRLVASAKHTALAGIKTT